MLNNADLIALVEACLDDGMAFGLVVKQVRNEQDCGLKMAVQSTMWALKQMPNDTRAVAMLAKRLEDIANA